MTKAKSGYKGVWLQTLASGHKRWRAYCWDKETQRSRYIGSFKTEAEAVEAYNDAAPYYYGEDAIINPIVRRD